MSTPKSLTLSSLITLVGEDKLYDAINKTSYQYVQTFDRDTPPRIFGFRTHNNPIEWLIFNNKMFLLVVIDCAMGHSITQRLIMSLLQYVQQSCEAKQWIGYEKNPNFDIFVDLEFIDDAKELIRKSEVIPDEIANAVWRDIRKITCKELDELMAAADHHNNYIYQFKEGVQKDFLVANANVLIKNLGR